MRAAVPYHFDGSFMTGPQSNPSTGVAQTYADANPVHKAMRAFAATSLGAKLFRPTSRHMDKLVAAVTGGRRTFVGMAAGLPVAMLTTTGAKSGQPRTNPVIVIPHGTSLGIIASNFGAATNPAWYHNLIAHPEADITVDGHTRSVVARRATPTEQQQIWRRGASFYPAYDDYQTRAGQRHIAAFILDDTGTAQ